MNIAFTTVLIILLLSPGFIFKIGYKSSPLSIKVPNRNLTTEFVWAIFPSIVLHTAAVSLVHSHTSYCIDFELLGNLIMGVDENDKVADSFVQVGAFIHPIFWYVFSLLVLAYLFGHLSRRAIRSLKLDRKKEVFRFSNKWHYIVKGECLDFPETPDNYEEISYTTADILCRVNKKAVVYQGHIFDYYLDGNGELEALHLKYPHRRLFDGRADDQHENHKMESRFLIIPFSEMVNININYRNIEDVPESSLTDEEKQQAVDLTPPPEIPGSQ